MLLQNIKETVLSEVKKPEFKLTVGFTNSLLLLSIGTYMSHSLILAGTTPDLAMPLIGFFVIGAAWIFRSAYRDSAPPTEKQRRNVLILFSVSSLTVFVYPYIINNYDFPLNTHTDLYVVGFFVELLVILAFLKILYFLVLKSGSVYSVPPFSEESMDEKQEQKTESVD